MDGRGALTQDPAFQKLKEFYEKNGDSINIANLFSADPERFEKFRYVITLTEVVCTCVKIVAVILLFTIIIYLTLLYCCSV